MRAYAYDQDEIDEVITELAQQILLPRLPPKGLSQEELRALKPWEGPRHFVLIDDVQDLRPAQSYPQKPPVGAALWKLMERARQVGLHVFSTRNSANWATMPMDPWVKSQTSAKVAQLYMDNDPQTESIDRCEPKRCRLDEVCWSVPTATSRGFWWGIRRCPASSRAGSQDSAHGYFLPDHVAVRVQ